MIVISAYFKMFDDISIDCVGEFLPDKDLISYFICSKKYKKVLEIERYRRLRDYVYNVKDLKKKEIGI